MEDTNDDSGLDGEELIRLRHDIKNQLSGIHLAIEQLRYEAQDPTEDFLFYLETIETSAININALLVDRT